MEHAVLRGRSEDPLTIGDAVLVGPHAHLNGTTVEDVVFIATGASLFPGSRAGVGCELRINSVLYVNSRLAPRHRRADREDRRG
jgi:carbonic anhydrase/acetyltransferase-like protein (isoleucine patch superfamily)